MASRPRLDLRRLARDAAATPGARREMRAPGGRDATGLMQVVRDHLDALVALQAGGLTWDAVAAGLTAQGFTTADGRPVTGRNLTGIISSVRRQAAHRTAAEAKRANRPDRPSWVIPTEIHRPPVPSAFPAASRLAPELRPGNNPRDAGLTGSPEAAPLSEAEIRQLQIDKHRHLFKKD